MLLGDVQSVLKSNFNTSWPVKMFAGGYCYYCDMGITKDGKYLRFNILLFIAHFVTLTLLYRIFGSWRL